jgi:hypothetical protein
VLECSGVARRVPNLQAAQESFHFRDALDEAVADGEVDADSAKKWWSWIEDADASGLLFLGPVMFRALATKTAR